MAEAEPIPTLEPEEEPMPEAGQLHSVEDESADQPESDPRWPESERLANLDQGAETIKNNFSQVIEAVSSRSAISGNIEDANRVLMEGGKGTVEDVKAALQVIGIENPQRFIEVFSQDYAKNNDVVGAASTAARSDRLRQTI